MTTLDLELITFSLHLLKMKNGSIMKPKIDYFTEPHLDGLTETDPSPWNLILYLAQKIFPLFIWDRSRPSAGGAFYFVPTIDYIQFYWRYPRKFHKLGRPRLLYFAHNAFVASENPRSPLAPSDSNHYLYGHRGSLSRLRGKKVMDCAFCFDINWNSGRTATFRR